MSAAVDSRRREPITYKFPDHPSIKKVQVAKLPNVQCGDSGIVSLFFQTEDQLRNFHTTGIKGVRDLHAMCTAKMQQNHEAEMIFINPDAYKKTDAAMELIAKHYGISFNKGDQIDE